MASFEIAREDTLVKVESSVGTGEDQLIYGADSTVQGKENAMIRSMGFDKIAECASSYKINKLWQCNIHHGFFINGNFAYAFGTNLQKINLTDGSLEAVSTLSFRRIAPNFAELVFDADFVYVIVYSSTTLTLYKLDINTLNLVSKSAVKNSLPTAEGLKVLFYGNYIAACVKNAIYVYDKTNMENVYSYTDEGLGNCGGVPFFTEDKTKIYFIKFVTSGSFKQFDLYRASFPSLSGVTKGGRLFQVSTSTNEINFVQSYYNNNYAFFIYREKSKIDVDRVRIDFVDMRKGFAAITDYMVYCYTNRDRTEEQILYGDENKIILKTDSEQGDIIFVYHISPGQSTYYNSYQLRRINLNGKFDVLMQGEGNAWIGNRMDNERLRSGCIANLSWEE